MQSVLVPQSKRFPSGDVRRKMVLTAPMASPSGVKTSRWGMMVTLCGMVTEAP